MVAKKFFEKEKSLAVLLLRGGMTPRQVANQTGISEGIVGLLVTQHGLQRRQKMTPELKTRICDLRRGGKNLQEIVELTGVKMGTVGVIVSKAGLKQKATITDEQKKAASELRKTTKLTLDQIAVNLNINPNSMGHLVWKHGWRKSDIVSDEQRQKIIALRGSDPEMYIHKMADTVGLKPSTVGDILTRAGLTLSKEQMSSRYEKDRIAREMHMHDLASENAGSYLGGFLAANDKCRWACSKNHEFQMRPSSVRVGQWCPECVYIYNKGPSGPCQDIFEYIQSLIPGESVEINNRKVIYPKELDIWIPGRSVAIEYCGLYWHGESHGELSARRRHLNKLELCTANGVRLITIFADEWKYRRIQVEGYLRAILQQKQEKMPARKLRLGKATPAAVSGFVEEFHIQGAGPGGVAYCLFDNTDRIIATATFSKKHDRGHQEGNDWTLNRYCVRSGCNTPGGLGRLLNAFVVEHSPDRVVSFSDKRWSEGALYRALGFVLTGTLAPDYSYFKNGSSGPRYHKFNYRRKKLIQMGADPQLTEWPMALSVGLDRIWDCGKDRWELIPNKTT